MIASHSSLLMAMELVPDTLPAPVVNSKKRKAGYDAVNCMIHPRSLLLFLISAYRRDKG